MGVAGLLCVFESSRLGLVQRLYCNYTANIRKESAAHIMGQGRI